jgi:hypothetical protein
MIVNPNGMWNTPKKEEVEKVEVVEKVLEEVVEEVVEEPKADETTSILAKKLKAKGK